MWQLICVKPNGYWYSFGQYQTKEEAERGADEMNEHRSKDGSEFFVWESLGVKL